MLRVTSTGSKSFSVAKKIDDKYVRVTLSRYPANSIEQARKKTPENILLLENGVNSTEQKREVAYRTYPSVIFMSSMKKTFKHE